MGTKYYQIGDIAKLAKVTTVALRHYQKIGLLVPSHSSSSGYRLYNDDDIERLHFILNAKAVGFTLKEIKQIFKFIAANVSSSKMKKLVVTKLQDIDDKLAKLNTMKMALMELNNLCDGVVQIKECPIVSQLKLR